MSLQALLAAASAAFALASSLGGGSLAQAGPASANASGTPSRDRCAGGPVAVVYPEAVWYTYVDADDIDEIVESHLKNGRVVERLLLPPDVGR